MRIGLGTVLLLAATSLVGLTQSPVAAATGCGAPETTWLGPATEGGSTSWDEPTNWSGGVPTADSVVCIPATGPGPQVDTGTAVAATLTLQGTLTIGTSLELGALEADGGAISGGSTTVNSSLTGSGLTVTGGATLDQWGTAVFGEWDAQGARITVHGDAVLASGGEIDTLGGLFTIADTGSLTYDSVEAGQGSVIGGFANHGEVTVTGGNLLMMGSSPEDAQPDQFSTGTFTGAPGSGLWISYTELRTGARFDHAELVDHVTVPAGNTVTLGNSHMVDSSIDGHLEADSGQTGTATLNGVDVTGQVHVVSGTLSVPGLAPTTLSEDGTLTSGEWIASLGATLDLPAITTVDTELALLGGSSFGDGLANLTGVGPNGTLLLGADMAVSESFRNEGTLFLDTGCRLDVGGKFRQLPTGTFYTYVDAAGRGQVRAVGPRDLAGTLVVQRDSAYQPPVGTVLSFISSDGRKGADDAFDRVVSPKYGTRKIRVDYGVDKVRLRVDRVG